MTATYENGVVPIVEINEEYEQKIRGIFDETKIKVLESFNNYQFNQGLEQLFFFIRSINKYADERKPWKLAKSDDAEDIKKLKTCLGVMIESLRLAIQMLAPVMPGIHEKVNDLMGLKPCEDWSNDLIWDCRLKGKSLGEKPILFPRES
jgi:methionyl-tRNA synthetase